jgi:hypothetical protein
MLKKWKTAFLPMNTAIAVGTDSTRFGNRLCKDCRMAGDKL